MKQILIVIAASALIFTACKSDTGKVDAKPATASEFYERVAELEETMSEPLLTTEAEIKARGDKQDFEGIVKSAKKMEDTVDVRINAIKNMPPVGHGGEDFKTMAVRYFEFIKSIYTGYRKIGEATTEEDRVKAADEMATIINNQQAVLDNLHIQQERYAANNHFVIDGK